MTRRTDGRKDGGEKASRRRRSDASSRKAAIRRLAADIAPLARKLVKLQKQATALGIFMGERALLLCPKCGLSEDVGAGGRLFTAFGASPASDTGLRFVVTKRAHVFRCPSCGAEVPEPEEMDL
jgi:predicted RNA-binding Zn-ribbon protein involved in translation (DUF1610 family)